ncbi:MAG: NusG domain II-containing protein [Treponema sp.]|nr:NusG domain II-containing protein [Treponema sp.]
MKKFVKPFDLLFVFFSLCVVLLSIVFAVEKDKGQKLLVVESPKGKYVFSLEKNGLYEIEGAIGKTIVGIEDGKVYVVESCCPNGTCVSAGKIEKSGQWIACLPNKVVIRLEGSKDEEVDVLAR